MGYVKNIDDSVTDDMLRDEFAAMGTITSARVMLDLKTARPRGFGFVCYSTPEAATRAVNEMNGKPIANKPIFVALAQRMEVRRAQQVRGSGGTGRGGQAGIKFNQQARNAGPAGGAPTQQPPTAPTAQQPPPTPAPAAHEALTAAALASATPEMQKNMIGERLYPLIHNSQPDLAGKITGMLLEMDNSELLHLLESDEALNAKITEALQVLEAHNTDE